MCRPRVEAHDGPMFNSYEMSRALVAERQGTLRHEARQHRLARGTRRAHRSAGAANVVRLAAPVDPASPGAHVPHGRAAA
jgi:hypothetical protein